MINFKTISAIAVTAAVVAIVPIGNAEAALITGVTASTNMGSSNGYNIQNIVNGSGLSSLSLTATHTTQSASNSWVSNLGIGTGNIDFNLNGQYSLQGFSFWNFNDSSDFFNNINVFGIQGVNISTSLDGSTYSALSGAPTQFAIGTYAPESPEQFAFAPTLANYVRLSVLSNYYGEYPLAAFNEVQFDGTPATAPTAVPTPALLPGLIGLGVAALRKRKAEAASKA